MSELSKRIFVALIGIPFAISVMYVGGVYFNISILFICFLAIGEFIDFLKIYSNNSTKIPIYIGTLSLPLLFSFTQNPKIWGIGIILIFFASVIIGFTFRIFRVVKGSIFDIGSFFTSIIYIGFTFSSLILIRNFNFVLLEGRDFFNYDSFLYQLRFTEDFTWFLVTLFAFISVWTCDSAAYFFGRAFGKTKLLPAVSPKKSREGAYAGLVAAILSFTLLNYFFIPEIPLFLSLLCGITVGVFGQIGDLAESMLKRDAEVKDSSALLPGHGGILDRFDSLMFVFPALGFLFLLSAFIG